MASDKNKVKSATLSNSQSPITPNHSPLVTRHLPLQGLRLLDIGCGGGLIAEPMARLGANVTAIDASEKNIRVAKLHAEQSGLEIDYRATTAEALLADSGIADSKMASDDASLSATPLSHSPLYDVVLALEIIEHVANPQAFVECCLKLLKPGGMVVFSTLNRTAKSFALAILGAEYVLRWLPIGTHEWKKFLRPSELARMVEEHGGTLHELMGMKMNPLTFEWSLTPSDLSVNYLVVAKKH